MGISLQLSFTSHVPPTLLDQSTGFPIGPALGPCLRHGRCRDTGLSWQPRGVRPVAKAFCTRVHSVVIENNSVVIVWSIQSVILEIYDLSSCEIILTRLIYQQMVPY